MCIGIRPSLFMPMVARYYVENTPTHFFLWQWVTCSAIAVPCAVDWTVVTSARSSALIKKRVPNYVRIKVNRADYAILRMEVIPLKWYMRDRLI
jgi:hypothetical protein